MRNEERHWLKLEIRKTLIPALLELGFENVKLTPAELKDAVQSTYPFGRFRRRQSTGFDLLEIQLNKYDKASFVFAAGLVPVEGIKNTHGDFSAEDVWCGWLPKNYAFYSVPLIGRGFSLWHWPSRKTSQADVQNLIAIVVAKVLPQIDRALRFDERGPNVKVFGA